MDGNDKTKKAAELLLEGATMLQISCPQCNDPIYKKRDGNLYCANCQRFLAYEGQTPQKQKAEPSPTDTNDPIQNKINQLAVQLEKENDQEKIIQLASTIQKLKELQG